MSRLEFMKELARLLDDLPREEKIEILKYYNGYFDDAGVENEAEIIARLESPEKIAAEVKAGMQDAFAEEAPAEAQEKSAAEENVYTSYDGYGYQEMKNTETEVSTDHNDKAQEAKASSPRQKKNGWTTLVIAIVLIVTFRFWFGLLAGLFGLAMGLIGLLVGLVGGVVGCIVSGAVMLVTAPLTGMLSLAVGIFLLGLLLLVGLLVGMVFGKLIPTIVAWIRKLFSGFREAVGGIIDGITGRR